MDGANGGNGPILRVENLCKDFRSGERTLNVIKDITFSFECGASGAIVGPSGCGKTTLLGLCAGLDTPTSGAVILNDVELGALDEDARAILRNQCVGFVFQNFQLIPTLTAMENVMVPLEFRGESEIESRAGELLAQVGLEDRQDHYPIQLSGGEQQRVAIARAFINRPMILFADEPTGNLDTGTKDHVADLLFELNRAAGTTLILVTHDVSLAERTDRILKIVDGRLTSE
jgi:putative ABC transport system ATP-binding protein